MHPTFSAADWSFFKNGDDPADYYRRVKRAGCAFAELVEPSRRPIARAAGLEILNIAGPGGLNRVDKRADLVATLRAQIEEAAAEKIGQLLVFSGNREKQTRSTGIDNCTAVLKEVAADAEKSGVTIMMEVFNTFDHADYDADSSEYAFAVARGVSSPAIKVLYDLYHMHRMGEDVAAEVTQNIELVGHVHIAGSPRRDFPGPQQTMDYPTIVRTIHAAGYRGTWGMEFITGPDGVGTTELERAVSLFRSYFY